MEIDDDTYYEGTTDEEVLDIHENFELEEDTPSYLPPDPDIDPSYQPKQDLRNRIIELLKESKLEVDIGGIERSANDILMFEHNCRLIMAVIHMRRIRPEYYEAIRKPIRMDTAIPGTDLTPDFVIEFKIGEKVVKVLILDDKDLPVANYMSNIKAAEANNELKYKRIEPVLRELYNNPELEIEYGILAPPYRVTRAWATYISENDRELFQSCQSYTSLIESGKSIIGSNALKAVLEDKRSGSMPAVSSGINSLLTAQRFRQAVELFQSVGTANYREKAKEVFSELLRCVNLLGSDEAGMDARDKSELQAIKRSMLGYSTATIMAADANRVATHKEVSITQIEEQRLLQNYKADADLRCQLILEEHRPSDSMIWDLIGGGSIQVLNKMMMFYANRSIENVKPRKLTALESAFSMFLAIIADIKRMMDNPMLTEHWSKKASGEYIDFDRIAELLPKDFLVTIGEETWNRNSSKYGMKAQSVNQCLLGSGTRMPPESAVKGEFVPQLCSIQANNKEVNGEAKFLKQADEDFKLINELLSSITVILPVQQKLRELTRMCNNADRVRHDAIITVEDNLQLKAEDAKAYFEAQRRSTAEEANKRLPDSQLKIREDGSMNYSGSLGNSGTNKSKGINTPNYRMTTDKDFDIAKETKKLLEEREKLVYKNGHKNLSEVKVDQETILSTTEKLLNMTKKEKRVQGALDPNVDYSYVFDLDRPSERSAEALIQLLNKTINCYPKQANNAGLASFIAGTCKEILEKIVDHPMTDFMMEMVDTFHQIIIGSGNRKGLNPNDNRFSVFKVDKGRKLLISGPCPNSDDTGPIRVIAFYNSISELPKKEWANYKVWKLEDSSYMVMTEWFRFKQSVAFEPIFKLGAYLSTFATLCEQGIENPMDSPALRAMFFGQTRGTVDVMMALYNIGLFMMNTGSFGKSELGAKLGLTTLKQYIVPMYIKSLRDKSPGTNLSNYMVFRQGIMKAIKEQGAGCLRPNSMSVRDPFFGWTYTNLTAFISIVYLKNSMIAAKDINVTQALSEFQMATASYQMEYAGHPIHSNKRKLALELYDLESFYKQLMFLNDDYSEKAGAKGIWDKLAFNPRIVYYTTCLRVYENMAKGLDQNSQLNQILNNKATANANSHKCLVPAQFLAMSHPYDMTSRLQKQGNKLRLDPDMLRDDIKFARDMRAKQKEIAELQSEFQIHGGEDRYNKLVKAIKDSDTMAAGRRVKSSKQSEHDRAEKVATQSYHVIRSEVVSVAINNREEFHKNLFKMLACWAILPDQRKEIMEMIEIYYPNHKTLNQEIACVMVAAYIDSIRNGSRVRDLTLLETILLNLNDAPKWSTQTMAYKEEKTKAGRGFYIMTLTCQQETKLAEGAAKGPLLRSVKDIISIPGSDKFFKLEADLRETQRGGLNKLNCSEDQAKFGELYNLKCFDISVCAMRDTGLITQDMFELQQLILGKLDNREVLMYRTILNKMNKLRAGRATAKDSKSLAKLLEYLRQTNYFTSDINMGRLTEDRENYLIDGRALTSIHVSAGFTLGVLNFFGTLDSDGYKRLITYMCRWMGISDIINHSVHSDDSATLSTMLIPTKKNMEDWQTTEEIFELRRRHGPPRRTVRKSKPGGKYKNDIEGYEFSWFEGNREVVKFFSIGKFTKILLMCSLVAPRFFSQIPSVAKWKWGYTMEMLQVMGIENEIVVPYIRYMFGLGANMGGLSPGEDLQGASGRVYDIMVNGGSGRLVHMSQVIMNFLVMKQYNLKITDIDESSPPSTGYFWFANPYMIFTTGFSANNHRLIKNYMTGSFESSVKLGASLGVSPLWQSRNTNPDDMTLRVLSGHTDAGEEDSNTALSSAWKDTPMVPGFMIKAELGAKKVMKYHIDGIRSFLISNMAETQSKTTNELYDEMKQRGKFNSPKPKSNIDVAIEIVKTMKDEEVARLVANQATLFSTLRPMTREERAALIIDRGLNPRVSLKSYKNAISTLVLNRLGFAIRRIINPIKQEYLSDRDDAFMRLLREPGISVRTLKIFLSDPARYLNDRGKEVCLKSHKLFLETEQKYVNMGDCPYTFSSYKYPVEGLPMQFVKLKRSETEISSIGDAKQAIAINIIAMERNESVSAAIDYLLRNGYQIEYPVQRLAITLSLRLLPGLIEMGVNPRSNINAIVNMVVSKPVEGVVKSVETPFNLKAHLEYMTVHGYKCDIVEQQHLAPEIMYTIAVGETLPLVSLPRVRLERTPNEYILRDLINGIVIKAMDKVQKLNGGSKQHDVFMGQTGLIVAPELLQKINSILSSKNLSMNLFLSKTNKGLSLNGITDDIIPMLEKVEIERMFTITRRELFDEKYWILDTTSRSSQENRSGLLKLLQDFSVRNAFSYCEYIKKYGLTAVLVMRVAKDRDGRECTSACMLVSLNYDHTFVKREVAKNEIFVFDDEGSATISSEPDEPFGFEEDLESFESVIEEEIDPVDSMKVILEPLFGYMKAKSGVTDDELTMLLRSLILATEQGESKPGFGVAGFILGTKRNYGEQTVKDNFSYLMAASVAIGSMSKVIRLPLMIPDYNGEGSLTVYGPGLKGIESRSSVTYGASGLLIFAVYWNRLKVFKQMPNLRAVQVSNKWLIPLPQSLAALRKEDRGNTIVVKGKEFRSITIWGFGVNDNINLTLADRKVFLSESDKVSVFDLGVMPIWTGYRLGYESVTGINNSKRDYHRFIEPVYNIITVETLSELSYISGFKSPTEMVGLMMQIEARSGIPASVLILSWLTVETKRTSNRQRLNGLQIVAWFWTRVPLLYMGLGFDNENVIDADTRAQANSEGIIKKFMIEAASSDIVSLHNTVANPLLECMNKLSRELDEDDFMKFKERTSSLVQNRRKVNLPTRVTRGVTRDTGQSAKRPEGVKIEFTADKDSLSEAIQGYIGYFEGIEGFYLTTLLFAGNPSGSRHSFISRKLFETVYRRADERSVLSLPIERDFSDSEYENPIDDIAYGDAGYSDLDMDMYNDLEDLKERYLVIATADCPNPQDLLRPLLEIAVYPWLTKDVLSPIIYTVLGDSVVEPQTLLGLAVKYGFMTNTDGYARISRSGEMLSYLVMLLGRHV